MDLKPGNVLIDNRPHGSVCGIMSDFGCLGDANSRLVRGLQTPETACFTVTYAEPELAVRVGGMRRYCVELDKTMDVHAFGKTVFETLERKPAWAGVREARQVTAFVANGVRPQPSTELCQRDDAQVRQLFDLAQCAWAQNPITRTTVDHILLALDGNKTGNSALGLPVRALPVWMKSSRALCWWLLVWILAVCGYVFT